MVKDMNNDGVIDPSDRRVLGHAEPSWTGSINSTLTWKGFDFSFNIYTSQGSKVYSPFMAEFTDFGQRGMGRLKMDFYTPAGVKLLGDDGKLYTTTEAHTGTYPFPTNGGNNKGTGQFWVNNSTGSQYFVNNSFTKVKNIIFDNVIINGMKMKNIDDFITADLSSPLCQLCQSFRIYRLQRFRPRMGLG
jgi:hypothetical protein